MPTISNRKISEIKAVVADDGTECVPVYNYNSSGSSDPSILFYNEWLWTTSDSIFNNAALNFKPQVSGLGAGINGDQAALSSSYAQLNVTGGTLVNTFAILYAAFNNSSSGQFLLNTQEYIYEGSCFVNRLGLAGTDRGEQQIGWANARAAGLLTSCVVFGYESDVSANWVLRNGQSGVYDVVDSGVPVVANTIIKYKLRTATVGSSYTSELYINDTLVASSSTNFPTDYLGIIHKSRSIDAGTARNLSMVGKQSLTIKAGA